MFDNLTITRHGQILLQEAGRSDGRSRPSGRDLALHDRDRHADPVARHDPERI